MLHDLRSMKLGEWHPREIYRTAALMDQKRRSLEPEDEYFEVLLQNEVLPALPDRADTALSKSLLDDAKSRIPRMRYVSETKLGQKSRKARMQEILERQPTWLDVSRKWLRRVRPGRKSMGRGPGTVKLGNGCPRRHPRKFCRHLCEKFRGLDYGFDGVDGLNDHIAA